MILACVIWNSRQIHERMVVLLDEKKCNVIPDISGTGLENLGRLATQRHCMRAYTNLI